MQSQNEGSYVPSFKRYEWISLSLQPSVCTGQIELSKTILLDLSIKRRGTDYGSAFTACSLYSRLFPGVLHLVEIPRLINNNKEGF